MSDSHNGGEIAENGIPIVQPGMKDDVIISLALRNLTLEKELARLSELYQRTHDKLVIQTIEFNERISTAWIAQYIQDLFTGGKIPIPHDILKRQVPVTITCRKEVIHLYQHSFCAVVHFEIIGRSDQVSFEFKLAPTNGNKEEYPEFHYGYTTAVPAKKRIRKSASIKPPALSA